MTLTDHAPCFRMPRSGRSMGSAHEESTRFWLASPVLPKGRGIGELHRCSAEIRANLLVAGITPLQAICPRPRITLASSTVVAGYGAIAGAPPVRADTALATWEGALGKKAGQFEFVGRVTSFRISWH
jgi:hypothetical protein